MNPKNPFRTRTNKNGEQGVDAERFWAARHEGRRRTIVYSIIAAGIVSLLMQYTFERQAFNEQAERSRTNCELVQEVSMLLSEISLDVAMNSDNQEFRQQWSEYAETFDNAIPPEADTCTEVFPKRPTIPFIE